MRTNRIHAVLRGLCLGVLAAGLSMPVLAEATAVDNGASSALGRLTGAAKGCGVNPARVRKASERLHSAIDASAGSPAERLTAHALFLSGQTTGERDARNDRTRCSAVHVDFSRLEIRLGRAPTEKVAAQRGVPPISALTH